MTKIESAEEFCDRVDKETTILSRKEQREQVIKEMNSWGEAIVRATKEKAAKEAIFIGELEHGLGNTRLATVAYRILRRIRSLTPADVLKEEKP